MQDMILFSLLVVTNNQDYQATSHRPPFRVTEHSHYQVIVLGEPPFSSSGDGGGGTCARAHLEPSCGSGPSPGGAGGLIPFYQFFIVEIRKNI